MCSGDRSARLLFQLFLSLRDKGFLGQASGHGGAAKVRVSTGLHFLCLLIVLCSVPGQSLAASCLHYDGEPLTLTGTMSLQTFYGPPNYGESPDTDSRETQAILVLSKPICVDAQPNDWDAAEKGQLRVTLVPPAGVDFRRYKGKKVTLSGTLFHAQTGHHRTPVLMQVQAIESAH